MGFRTMAALTMAAALATGCAGTSMKATGGATAASAKTPIWAAREVAAPLGILQVEPGGKRRLSLRNSVPGAFRGAMLVAGKDVAGLSLSIDGEYLEASASTDAAGTGIARIEVETAKGKSIVALPTVVARKSIHRFVYRPKEGSTPARVFVAGGFNGWNATKDMLAKLPDGTFALDVPLDPGQWAYKFVVDGNWVQDPDNPEREGGGYGNSILNVKGELGRTFAFVPLAAGMPGAAPQGGLRALFPAGGKLIAERIALTVNNVEVDSASWNISADGAVLAFDFPATLWGAENSIAIVATDSEGRVGQAVLPFVTSAAKRSPLDETIYFTMTDRFFDGDPSLNAPSDHPELHPLANYKGGDFAGIRKKIEEGYFTDLGVTTIWISPPNKQTEKVERDTVPPNRLFTSYHGYWPTSSTETNVQFGTMEDLRAMVAAAHERGIAVLLDFVSNHVHRDHPLLVEHPDWVTPKLTPDGRPNIRLYDEFPLTTWFDDFIPSFNYEGNDEIVRIMADNAQYWLEATGADGFRHDAVKHVPQRFWREVTNRLDDYGRRKGSFIYQVGETISGRGTINEFVGQDMLTGQFDFPLYFTVQSVLARGERTMKALGEELALSQTEYPASAMMSPLIGNHDVIRFMGYADNDIPPAMDEKEIGYKQPPRVERPDSYKKLQLAFAFLLTIPGAPMIYYGDEIGMTGAHDPDNRRPMPWENWDAGQLDTKAVVEALGKARRESIALRRGAVHLLPLDDERLAYLRIAPEETTLTVLSRNPRDVGFTLNWPEWLGAPARLEPLAVSGQSAELSAGALRVSDAAYSFSVWRVQW